MSGRKRAKPLTPEAMEALAAELEASGQYRVLRRLSPPTLSPWPAGLQDLLPDARLAVFLDLETTGLDPQRDEVIELAMAPFAYAPSGEVLAVFEPYQSLNQPSAPLREEISALTGLTDDMLEGQRLDVAGAEALARKASLVIAHNARFDRRFAERLSPVFAAKPWACSMAEIDWDREGFEGRRLSYLAGGFGYFFDGHRAVNDCLAAVELMSRRLPKSKVLALAALLATARRPTCRLYALHSPFEMKETLKARGYRWNADAQGAPKAWYRDVPEDQREAEIAFLEAEIYRGEAEVLVKRVSALTRYSDRE